MNSLFLLVLLCQISFGSEDKRTYDFGNEKMQDVTTASTPSYESKGDYNVKNYPLILHQNDYEQYIGLHKRKRKKPEEKVSNLQSDGFFLPTSKRVEPLESISTFHRETYTRNCVISNRQPRKYIDVRKIALTDVNDRRFKAGIFNKTHKHRVLLPFKNKSPQIYKKTNAAGSKNYYLHLSDSCGKQYTWWVDTKSSKEEVDKLISESKLNVGVFALQNDVDFDELKIDDIVIYFEYGKKYYKDSVCFTKIIEKQEDGIRYQILHGEEKGKQHKIHKDEIKSKVMKVEYDFSKQEEQEYIEKFQIATKKVLALEKTIEEKLFLLCYKAHDSSCKKMLCKWKEAHIHKYGLDYEFKNSNLFWAEAIARLVKWWDMILSIHESIKNILESMPTQENNEENHLEESKKSRILYEMLWLEIKAQGYGEKFQEFVTDKTNEAFHLKAADDKLTTEHIQNLYDDVKGIYENGSKDEEKNDSHFFGLQKVYSMTKAVQKIVRKNAIHSKAVYKIGTYNFDCENFNKKVIDNNIKEYMKTAEKLGMDNIMDKRKTKYSDRVKGDGAFATERIEQYEVVGIWTGDLYDAATDLHVFDYGGAKSHRIIYVASFGNTHSKIKSEFILDPNTIQGAVNDCRNAENFYGSSYLSTAEERERFNLGWVGFYYKGIPYLAEVALDTIEAEKELCSYYGGKYNMSNYMKHIDDKKNRKDIVDNVENHVSRILKKNQDMIIRYLDHKFVQNE